MEGQAYAVLGATGGIGSALVDRILARGGKTVLAARDESRLKAMGDRVDAPFRSIDAAEPADVQAVIDLCMETYGRFDGIVNSVGSILLRPAHMTKIEDFDETVRVNLRTAFAVVHTATKALRKSGGSIVLVSTAAARIGLPNHEAIAAAKAGVQGLALSAAATYASAGIRVNVVAPGLIDTPLASGITGSEKALEASRAMHALGRIGQPDEVASAIEWFLDPAQSFVTGQILGVDGGLGTIRPR
ncbi:MAG: NAD(P)-dependent dehydrogenase (short-subunit alcohol dehydrogenase family) [Planctomycetota bacterium]|jgi:NAD(P)-dependent dehydrogenase (short-subunit alcohol dehydrogenase family)